MTLIKRDMNELRLNSIFLLPKDNNPNYYIMFFKNIKSFFYGMARPDLVEDLDFIIKQKIELIMGAEINNVLMTYKNILYLDGFTRSKNPLYQNLNIYKYSIQGWLDEIEQWCLMRVMELEPEIRFTLPAKQYI